MGIEGNINAVLQADSNVAIGRCYSVDVPQESANRVRTIIMDATSVIQGGVINNSTIPPFGKVVHSLACVFRNHVTRYPNVSAIVSICDVSTHVPNIKSIAHREDRGRSAYTFEELFDLDVIRARYPEGSTVEDEKADPVYYVNPAFPMEWMPAEFDWKKSWHTLPSRRAMESGMTRAGVLAAQYGFLKDHENTAWMKCWQESEEDFVEMNMDGRGLYGGGLVAKIARKHVKDPIIFLDGLGANIAHNEFYEKGLVASGVAELTGELQYESTIQRSSLSEPTVTCVKLGGSEEAGNLLVEHEDLTALIDVLGRTGGEFDVKLLSYIQPAFGGHYVLYTDDTDVIPIVLLHIMRLQLNAWGLPLRAEDAKHFVNSDGLAWMPSELWIDRTANSILRQDPSSNARCINLMALFNALCYGYIRPNDPAQVKAKQCMSRITGAVLGMISCGTDYCPRMSHLYLQLRDQLEGKRKRNVDHVLSSKVCWEMGTKKPSLQKALGPWTDLHMDIRRGDTIPILMNSFAEWRVLIALFQEYMSVAAARYRMAHIPILTEIPAEGLDYCMHDLKGSWDQLQAAVGYDPAGTKRALAMPPFELAQTNVRRWLFNFNYWLNGWCEKSENVRFDGCRIENGLSRWGWRLERVKVPINPIDISQVMLPNLSKSGIWPPEADSLFASSEEARDLFVWEVVRSDCIAKINNSDIWRRWQRLAM